MLDSLVTHTWNSIRLKQKKMLILSQFHHNSESPTSLQHPQSGEKKTFSLYKILVSVTIQVALERLRCGPLGGRSRSIHCQGRHLERVLCSGIETWTHKTQID